jgi:hypothetical protein
VYLIPRATYLSSRLPAEHRSEINQYKCCSISNLQVLSTRAEESLMVRTSMTQKCNEHSSHSHGVLAAPSDPHTFLPGCSSIELRFLQGYLGCKGTPNDTPGRRDPFSSESTADYNASGRCVVTWTAVSIFTVCPRPYAAHLNNTGDASVSMLYSGGTTKLELDGASILVASSLLGYHGFEWPKAQRLHGWSIGQLEHPTYDR